MKVLSVKRHKQWFIVTTETRIFWIIKITDVWVGHIEDGGLLWFEAKTKNLVNKYIAKFLTMKVTEALGRVQP